MELDNSLDGIELGAKFFTIKNGRVDKIFLRGFQPKRAIVFVEINRKFDTMESATFMELYNGGISTRAEATAALDEAKRQGKLSEIQMLEEKVAQLKSEL